MLKFQNNDTTIIATFEDFILTTYVIIDELYHRFAPSEVKRRRHVLDAKLSDSEIITIALCGELVGIDSENAWFSFVKKNYRHLFPQLCNRSRFNRTRRALMQTTELLRQKMLSAFPLPISPYCIVDSFPLAVCKFGRARYCKVFRDHGADYGKCPSKKETYFGYKVHALITLEGYITAFEITPASTDDREGLRDLMDNCSNFTVLADKGYVGEKLMQEMQKHGDVPFSLRFIVMDPGYNGKNRRKIEDNARLLGIPIEIFETDVFASSVAAAGDSPCYLCARMRRGYLYAKAKELGCNKIALGHHKSDVIETTLMAMLYGGQIQGMLPRIKSKNFEGLELIRPMYCITEESVLRWRDGNGLDFIACACKFTESTASEQAFSARKRVKKLIADLKKEIPSVEDNIFQSIHNVQLDTLVNYKTEGVEVSFLKKFAE